MIRREILPRVLARLKLENGVGWEFEATADNRKKLEDLAEFERQCCRGLSFERTLTELDFDGRSSESIRTLNSFPT